MQQYGMFCEEINLLTKKWELDKRSPQKISYLNNLREFLHYEKFHRGYSNTSQSMTVQCIVPLLLDGQVSMTRLDGFFSSEGKENPIGELVMDIPDQETIFLHFSKDEEERKQSLYDFYRLKQLMNLGDSFTDEELFEVLRCCFMPLPFGCDDFKLLWRDQLTIQQLTTIKKFNY